MVENNSLRKVSLPVSKVRLIDRYETQLLTSVTMYNQADNYESHFFYSEIGSRMKRGLAKISEKIRCLTRYSLNQNFFNPQISILSSEQNKKISLLDYTYIERMKTNLEKY